MGRQGELTLRVPEKNSLTALGNPALPLQMRLQRLECSRQLSIP